MVMRGCSLAGIFGFDGVHGRLPEFTKPVLGVLGSSERGTRTATGSGGGVGFEGAVEGLIIIVAA